MGSGNPTSGHTNKNLTVHNSVTNADGLTDGEHIISPTLTNMIEGIHGNGVVMYDDTSSGEGDRNIPANIPGAVNYASATTFTVKGGYAVLDGTMYQFAGGVGATTTYTLETSSASAAGSPAVVNSGKEALVVVYVCADNTSTVKNIYWEIGGATPIGTSAYPTTPASFLDTPAATGNSALANTQTVVLAVLRVVYAAGSGDLTLAITEVNDKRVFVRPSPMYFSPVTGGDVASTNELLDLDAFHSGVGTGALGASRFGAMWQSFGAAVTGSTVPDDNKDVLYYSGTHAARFTRSVFDRVLTSADATITIKSTDANALILTPTASTNVITNGSFPAGYIIYIRNLDTDDYVRFALTSSASSTMASYYEIAPATFASFICTTSHASYPTFALLFDDTIDTPQIAADAVTSAKIADGAVIAAAIGADAVTNAKIANDAVDTENIADDAITAALIDDGAVGTAAIANSNVTLAKLANIADDTMLGNISGSAAAPAAMSIANVHTLIGEATESITGLMSVAHHDKLDSIAQDANNYVHPNHSGDVTSTADGATVIGNNKVTTAKILDANVTTAKIAADAVTSAKIADGAVDTEHIATDAIEEEHIQDAAVVTAAIGDEQVTLAKLAHAAANTVLVRDANSAGDPSFKAVTNTQILIGDGTGFTAAALSGDATMTNAGVVAIGNDKITADMIGDNVINSEHYAAASIDNEHLADNAVDSDEMAADAVITAKILNSNVTLAKLANIADDRVLGNISGSAAAPAELTAANLRTLLGVADGSLTTNDFTNADHSKLNAIEASATADQTDAEIRAAVEAASDSNVFTDADHTKLNGIEASATADQSNAEIRAAVEAATDSNVFTDADHSKLNGIEASADVTDTTNVVAALTAGTNVAIAGDGTISATDTNTTYTVGDGGLTQKNFTTTLKNKLDAIEASATADQTDAEIRAAVEAATDSNVFTDADHSKLNGIAASATAYADSDAISAVEGEATLALAGSVTVATGKTFVSRRLPVVALTASTTLSEATHAGNYVFVTGSSIVITIPDNQGAGVHFTIINNDGNGFTLRTNSGSSAGDNMNGAQTDIAVAARNGVTCISTGTDYVVLGV